jgi:membrane fusion protein (multidrug efflux system)
VVVAHAARILSRNGARPRCSQPIARRLALAAGLVAALLPACERAKTVEKVAPPPPAVVVTEVLQRTVPIYSEYVGRTEALETIELRARVEGFLEQILFQEGQRVKTGDVLFIIEQAPYQATVRAAKAQLDKARSDLARAREASEVLRAQAQLEQARAAQLRTKQDVDRFRPLAEQEAIPKQDLENAIARDLESQAQVRAAESVLKDASLNQKTQIQLSEAAIEQAQASLTQAELSLSYTTIKAPVDGIIGIRKVDRGNLVGRGEATLLATMSTIDPFRVAFNVSELDYLRFIERAQNARIRRAETVTDGLVFELILADGRVYPHNGKRRTADRALDPRTGTILVEALFPNPDNFLRAGQFGRVRVAAEERVNAILVPQRSVQELQGARTAYVVGPENKVALRSVKLSGDRWESYFIVDEGLKPGDRVILEGIQKVRPGMVVAPTTEPISTEPKPPAPKR